MALTDNAFYVDSAGYTAVTAWATGAAIAAGALRRQNAAPAVGSERVFVCIVAGTTHATTEPTWTVTRGAKTTDNTVTWQEVTGIAALNGDAANTPGWTAIKNTAITLGQVIKRDNGASYQICTTAGTAGNGAEPSFSDTAGTTTVDNTVTWTGLGVVGNFTGNQAPHARLNPALATNWAQAGNTIFVKSSHAESTGNNTNIAGDGTIASPQRILCHNGGAYPPLAANLTTGATLTNTGSNWNLTGNYYVEGISFVTSSAGTNIAIGTSNVDQRYKNCTFTRGSTTGSITVGVVASGNFGTYEFDNCTCSFANANNAMGVNAGKVLWKNSTFFSGVAVPTSVFSSGVAAQQVHFELHGVDLSAAGSGKTIFPTITTFAGLYRMVNCKLNASVTVAATPARPSHRMEIINCDSGAVNYRNEIYDYAGTLTTETTIVLTGGASDGTTPISWKVITTANAKFDKPFECFPIILWNDTTGASKTLTIQGIWGGGAVPNDDEIWVEVEYLGASGNPGSSFVSDAKATVLTTGAGQDAGSGTWGGSTTKFALAVTFTPQMKGPIVARVKCAKASSTFYIDPRATLS